MSIEGARCRGSAGSSLSASTGIYSRYFRLLVLLDPAKCSLAEYWGWLSVEVYLLRVGN